MEFMRRVGKEYDAAILAQFQRTVAARAADFKTPNSAEGRVSEPQFVIFRATPLQQLIRAVIHGVTFGVAYIIMLLGELGPLIVTRLLTGRVL
jgi:copper transporter 1